MRDILTVLTFSNDPGLHLRIMAQTPFILVLSLFCRAMAPSNMYSADGNDGIDLKTMRYTYVN